MVTSSARETRKLGSEFARKIKSGGVVALYGDLGVGKTTFVQGVAEGLGIKSRLVSPTFVITRRYLLSVIRCVKLAYLWHVDLYRLTSVDDIKAVGIEELWQDPKNIVLIEWPEKIEGFLPEKRWEIGITTEGENTREILITRIGK